jgi:hypothetical protein
MPNQWIVPREDGTWGVRPEGANRPSAVFPTQKEAIAKGRELCQNQGSELFILNREGEIRERNSYGNDPHPPKG